MQVIKEGVNRGLGYSGVTVYVGVGGIALTYLRLHECLARAAPGSPLAQWAGSDAPALAATYLQAASDLVHSTRRNPVRHAHATP